MMMMIRMLVVATTLVLAGAASTHLPYLAHLSIKGPLLQGLFPLGTTDGLQKNVLNSFFAQNQIDDFQSISPEVVESLVKRYTDSLHENGNQILNRLFDEFKVHYNKSYTTELAQVAAKNHFTANLKMVLQNNIRALYGTSTYQLTMIKSSDMSTDEAMRLRPLGHWPSSAQFYDIIANDSSYANSWVFDPYRQHHQVGPIENQGSCGSCYAFAVAAAVESYWSRKGHGLVTLSPQQLVDCTATLGNSGCKSGSTDKSFNYIKQHGLNSWKNYPYHGKLQKCDHNLEKHPVAHIKNWHYVTPQGNEEALRKAVEKDGPVAIILQWAPDLGHYRSGIWGGNCNFNSYHAVVIVGYGHDAKSNQDYWILKNQWGANWGEHGYFKLRRNHGNICHLASWAIWVE